MQQKCAPKDMYEHIHKNFIHNISILEATHMSTRKHKLCYLYYGSLSNNDSNHCLSKIMIKK